MDYSIIKRYFLELGSSYYKSKEFKVLDGDYKPIGNYGIGFLAGFMISPKILVRTKHDLSSSIIEIEIEKDEQYVAMKEIGKPNFVGTEIVLNLNAFLTIWDSNIEELKEYLKENFLFKDIKVELYTENGEQKYDKVTINNTEISEAVDLSKYLKDVELSLKYSKPHKIYKNYLTDVLDTNAAVLEDAKVKYIPDDDEKVPLKKYVENSKLETIEVILVQDDEISTLKTALEVYDDGDEIFEYVWGYNYPTSIEVITKCESLRSGWEYRYGSSEEIIGFDIKEFECIEDVYHDDTAGTIYNKKEYNLFGMEGIDKYIELRDSEIENHLLGWYRANNEIYRKLFVRGIFVKNINSIYLGSTIQSLSIHEIKMNVLNTAITPTVNRSSLKENDSLMIENSVYLAVCLDILENTHDHLERMLMSNYLYTFMDYKNSLIKEEFYPKSYVFGI